MRYNSYRQYVTLNGVKRENKNEFLKKLKPYYKNIMRYIPKTEYNDYVLNHSKMTWTLVVNADNTIRSISFLVRDQDGSQLKVFKKINIPVPASAIFNSAYDSAFDNFHGMTVRYYDESDQQITFEYTKIPTTSTSSGNALTGDYIGSLIPNPDAFFTVAAIGADGYYVKVPIAAKYYVVNIDLSGVLYDDLPLIPITYFE